MSADTSFFLPFFQQEMEGKNNENENGTTFLVTSFPGSLRRENNTFIKQKSEHAGSLVTILFVQPCITMCINEI